MKSHQKLRFCYENYLHFYVSTELQSKRRCLITWFTACNNDQINPSYFEICLAGIEDKRLFFVQDLDIFMFFNPSDNVENRHKLMGMNLIENKILIACSRGNLQLVGRKIGIGTTGTMLQIENEFYAEILKIV